MATRSFTDNYTITKKDVNKFYKIVSNPSNVPVRKIKGHKTIKGKAIKKLFGIDSSR